MRNIKFLIIVSLCLLTIAVAQKPSEPIKLNPAASEAYLKLEQQKQAIEYQQRLITVGAGIPPTHTQWSAVEGIVVFSVPPAPIPSPTPK